MWYMICKMAPIESEKFDMILLLIEEIDIEKLSLIV